MSFLKKYWYLLLVTLITVGVGIVAYLTSTKLEQQKPVAPTVPQVTPKAVNETNCKLVFAISTGPTNTPTNTPTATPTGVTNTPTNTPTATPTSSATAPECTNLTLSPSTGIPPFPVTATCTGKDIDGDITAVEFTLPDGTTKLVEQNVGSPGSLTTTYTLSQNGTYTFSCRVRDNNFVFSSVPDVCKKQSP